MSHFPARRFPILLLALGYLALLAGCQGFSSSSPGTQNNSQNQQPGDLTAAPATVSFGNVQVGTTQTLSDTVTNTGGSDLTISQSTVSTSAFSTSGLSLPLTLPAGQSATFSIVFAPQTAGSTTGTLILTSDGSGSPLSIALSGTAVSGDGITANPASINFGSAAVGSTQNQTETLTNSATQSLTISQASISGAGFNYTGLSLPLTLAPNQSTTFGLTFAPASAGASDGQFSITVSGFSTTLDIALSGTGTSGTTGATLAAIPVSLTFQDIQTGKSEVQTETIQNTGGASASISQVTASGAGFSVSGISTPLTLAPGQTTSFSVSFEPQSTGSFSGNVAITSNASNPTLNVALSGSAIAASSGQLNVSPSTINVGNVTVGTSGSQTGTLTATGASVVVSSVDVGSSEFSISGFSLPLTLSAGQSVTFTVTFTPQSSGTASTSVSFVSNASNSPSKATLAGTGVAAPSHSVNLSWNADGSPNVTGYNVYRSTGSSGTYAKINSSLIAATAYTDTSVSDGTTYYYETTAVNSSGEESARSTAVQAVIPPP
jgi:hypothetical protein